MKREKTRKLTQKQREKLKIRRVLRGERKQGNTDVDFTEQGETFERLITKHSIVKNKKTGKWQIKPTTENEHYASKFGFKKELKGFFAGDPDEWGSILLRDNYLPGSGEIFVATLRFPKGTPYIKGKRPVSMARGDDFVDEQFIIHNRPVTPIKLRELTDREYNEMEEKLKDLGEDDGELWL